MYKKQENRFRYNPEQIIPGTSILLTLDFYNPDVEQHAHPEHKKNDIGISFGSKNEHEWREMFASSFSILAKVSPGYVDEINKIIRKIIPFDVSYKVHNSGSYSDVIGHLIMSYPTGMDQPELALLEAILHEYNHNKLNIILQTESLVLNDRSEKYYSPYRPDARHIHGIYLGLHAIV
jgi:HEXXH motif-containing protein